VPRSICLAFLALLLAGPFAVSTAQARPSAEDSMRAGQIQVQAKEAWEAGKDSEALRLASRAISLDPGATTWLAQQIRVEVLEEQGKLEEAMTHVRTYLRIDGLFPEHEAWGEEAKERIGEKLATINAALAQRRARTGAGAGMAIGGAIPLAIGIGWLGNYGSKTGQGLPAEDYAGFLDGGAVMVGIGGVLEGVGIALIASGATKPAVASRPRIAPTLAASPGKDGRWSLGLTGRW